MIVMSYFIGTPSIYEIYDHPLKKKLLKNSFYKSPSSTNKIKSNDMKLILLFTNINSRSVQNCESVTVTLWWWIIANFMVQRLDSCYAVTAIVLSYLNNLSLLLVVAAALLAVIPIAVVRLLLHLLQQTISELSSTGVHRDRLYNL